MAREGTPTRLNRCLAEKDGTGLEPAVHAKRLARPIPSRPFAFLIGCTVTIRATPKHNCGPRRRRRMLGARPRRQEPG